MAAVAKIAAIGDIGLSGSLEKYSTSEPILSSAVRERINSADAVIGNFEFPFPGRGVPYHRYARPHICAEPKMLHELRGVNNLILTFANNHIMDWGPDGMHSTVEAANKLGVPTVGVGDNLELAAKPHHFSVDGIRFSILAAAKSFCAATENRPGILPIKADLLRTLIRQQKELGTDHVLIALHWGVEYSQYPSPNDVTLAHTLIEAGASVILGHHPHTLQGVQEYEGGLIAYSLGNFVMDIAIDDPPDENSLRYAHYSAILEVIFSKTAVVSYNAEPAFINENMRVELPASPVRTQIKEHLSRLSDTISKQSFYKQAFGNVQQKTIVAWTKKIKQHGFGALILFLKTLKTRHVKMLVMYYYYKLINKRI